MLNRRIFILASLASALLPAGATAGVRAHKTLSWTDCEGEMKRLASAYADRTITQSAMAARGVQLLQNLDAADNEFQAAVQASYESGNRFWLWQRLTKESDINGGILNIEQGQDVPLHDHPGATGMVRVLSGEVEVWQFDRLDIAPDVVVDGQAVLERVVHRVLHPGDMAILSPGSGNIHALRVRSQQCRMLDYFIPPYVRSERTWYQPVDSGWRDRVRITCEGISENDFYMS